MLSVFVNMNILSLEIFLIFLGTRDSSSDTVEICTNNGANAKTVTLELNLSNLTHYEGYCTCRVNRVNQGGNVTMEADIQIDGCESLYLQVERWNYQTSCGEEPGYDQTQSLLPGQFYRIFMKRSLGEPTPTIGGSITFRSLNSDKLALACEDATGIYDKPPPTTTSASTLGPSMLPTANIARMCRNSGATAETVTLELNLSNLTHYEENCTCRVNPINKRGDVIMEEDIQIDGCDSLYLQVEKWNYQTSCGDEPGYDQTQFLDTGQFYKIFMSRSLGEPTPTIGGSITFRSLNSDKLALACKDAVYDIQPPTTTASNPGPSILPTKNTAGMCRNSSATSETVTLELSLSNLTNYKGNCTCLISRIKKRGNVIMEKDIQIDGCDSLNLQVEKWNYQTSCGEELGYDQTQLLDLGQSYKIFLNRSLGESAPTIGGSITFRSVTSDELSLVCEDAVYDIPPLTKTASSPGPSILSTILAIVGGVLVGLIVLLVTIFLYMRYRKKQQQVHGVEEQEGVTVPHDTRQRRRNYETLGRRELGNQGYEDIFSNSDQMQDDVNYENGIFCQDQTSCYEPNEAAFNMQNCQISATSFDNDIQNLKPQSEVLYENVTFVKAQRSLHENAYANDVIRSDQTSLGEIPYINAVIFSDQTLQNEVSYTNAVHYDNETPQSTCLDNDMQEETQTYVNLH